MKLLIAVDFSETATRAAQWATEFFAPGAELVLVHVTDLPRHEAEGQMRSLAARLVSSAPRIEIRAGTPHEQIEALATDTRPDLVVIGPHGDGPCSGGFLGTTADKVVRTSPVSVLVATNPPPGAPTRILTPVEDASITPRLLAWTKSLAEQFDAGISLLHVWSNAVYSHVASMSYAVKPTEAEAREEIGKEFQSAADRWRDEAVRAGIARDRVTATVKYGRAGDVIVETAPTIPADLIILGRRGSGLVAPALLGSTVGAVIKGARCPVLVIADDGGADGRPT